MNRVGTTTTITTNATKRDTRRVFDSKLIQLILECAHLGVQPSVTAPQDNNINGAGHDERSAARWYVGCGVEKVSDE